MKKENKLSVADHMEHLHQHESTLINKNSPQKTRLNQNGISSVTFGGGLGLSPETNVHQNSYENDEITYTVSKLSETMQQTMLEIKEAMMMDYDEVNNEILNI